MRITTLIAALAVATAACGDDDWVTAPVTIGDPGAISFQYAGASATGTNFIAAGAIPASYLTDFSASPWAAGTIAVTPGQLAMAGAIQRSTAAWDVANISVATTRTGTFKVTSSCTATELCTAVSVVFGGSHDQTSFMFSCTLSTGTVVVVTALTSTTAQGTFSGSGACRPLIGPTSEFAVTNGSFSIGLSALQIGSVP